MDTRKIIDFAAEDDAKEMREALYANIYDRVSAAFEEKRREVASNLLGLATEEKKNDKEDDDEDCEKAAKKEVDKHEKEMH